MAHCYQVIFKLHPTIALNTHSDGMVVEHLPTESAGGTEFQFHQTSWTETFSNKFKYPFCSVRKPTEAT